jgi:NAD(P)-dependent dehydrogenase (short-subunit alcohol dehydrogenase family)
MAVPELTLDARGHELQFATNHLGHFQLVVRLWPALKATPGARVISVSSNGHRFSPVVFEDLAFERRGYDPWAAYGQSKTANILFALELDRRGEAHDVRAFSLHPGSIPGTGLERHVPRQELIAANIIDAEGRPVVDPSRDLKSLPMGAATQVWCAVSPQLAGKGGVFCLDCDIAEVLPEGSGFTDMAENAVRGRLSGVAAHAIDPKAASDLWALSETLTGVRLES